MSHLAASPEALAYYADTFALTPEQVQPLVLMNDETHPAGLNVHTIRQNGNEIGHLLMRDIGEYAALPYAHDDDILATEVLATYGKVHRVISPVGKLLLPNAVVKTGTIREMTIERVTPDEMPVELVRLGKNDRELKDERSEVIIRASSTVGNLAVGITTTRIETTRRYARGHDQASDYIAAFAGTLPTTAMTEFDMRRNQARDRQAVAMTNAYRGGRVSPR